MLFVEDFGKSSLQVFAEYNEGFQFTDGETEAGTSRWRQAALGSLSFWRLQAVFCPAPPPCRLELSRSPGGLGSCECVGRAVGERASCWVRAKRSSCRAGHLGPRGEGQRGRCRPPPSPVPAPLHQRLTDDPRSFAPPHLATLPHGVTRSDLERQVCRGRGARPWPLGAYTPG